MEKRIQKILIANRGEIAIRIAKTCSALKIPAVALMGKDIQAYLDINTVLKAANEAQADAIHPGYGFLSENPDFARAVEKAGLTFIGPSAQAMECAGDKAKAKKIASRLAIPTVPFKVESRETDSLFAQTLSTFGFPLLLKPVAGGGGKGMIKVEKKSDLASSILQAREAALSAFGDGRLMAEKWMARARHIEIQIAGDAKEIKILGERDCTLQRRHQKIVEEAPCAFLTDPVRKKIYRDAKKIMEDIGYQNLGTVEFLLDEDGQYYFMEVNARLQVEHPITEATTGLDLVAIQIGLAQGIRLQALVGSFKTSGHAIEARVYSEDPEAGFLPATGKILKLKFPEDKTIRIDTGIQEGMSVGSSFDPMLAKIIVHSSTREQALSEMDRTLSNTVLLGIQTNLNFLRWLTTHADVKKGKIDTAWVERTLPAYQAFERSQDLRKIIALANYARSERTGEEDSEVWSTDPWKTMVRWKMGTNG